jgi:hypothetical protein
MGVQSRNILTLPKTIFEKPIGVKGKPLTKEEQILLSIKNASEKSAKSRDEQQKHEKIIDYIKK